MTTATKAPAGFRSKLRDRVAKACTLVEDIVYVGLGIMLAGAAVVLLASLVLLFVRGLFSGSLPGGVMGVLDHVLLILMIVELLYTVQLSFREHVEQGDVQFRNAMIELIILTAMTLSLVWCLVLLRKRHPEAVAERT